MRSVSAALNRVFLAFFGLIIVCASAWFLASGLDAGHHLPGLSAYLAAAQDQFGAILSPRAHWLVPCGVLASALAFVTGLFLLLMQVPRRPANSSLRISGSRRHPAGYSLPRCSVAGTLRAGTGCSRGRTMHRLRHRFPEQALGSGGHERRTRLRGRMDRHRTTQAAERGRGHVSWDTSQAARCPRTASTLREFDINIEGRHRPAVASNHWNRRMRRGVGRTKPCPTLTCITRPHSRGRG